MARTYKHLVFKYKTFKIYKRRTIKKLRNIPNELISNYSGFHKKLYSSLCICEHKEYTNKKGAMVSKDRINIKFKKNLL